MKRITQEELNEVLRLHRLHEEGHPDGRRAVLDGYNLSGMSLRDADLRGADLRYADLRGADLRYADLRGADLRGADLRSAVLCDAVLRSADLRDTDLRDTDLWSAVGNMREVKSAHFDTWHVAWTRSPSRDDWLQIGCQRHTLADWKTTDDEVVQRMEVRALGWWRRYKDLVIAMVETSPAVPWGKPSTATGEQP